MNTAPSILDLRRELAAKFPDAHRHRLTPKASPRPKLPAFPQENEHLPEVEFEAPIGLITEISVPQLQSGSAAIIAHLMSEDFDLEQGLHDPLALIDEGDHYDPASHTAEENDRLLWLRCHGPEDALKAADILLRDSSLPRILMDLSLTQDSSLRRIPTSSWHRLGHLVRASDHALIAITPRPLIPCAQNRYQLSHHITLDDIASLAPPEQALHYITTRRKSATA